VHIVCHFTQLFMHVRKFKDNRKQNFSCLPLDDMDITMGIYTHENLLIICLIIYLLQRAESLLRS